MKRVARSVVLAAVAASLAPAGAPAFGAQEFGPFASPGLVNGITLGPDGNLWVAESVPSPNTDNLVKVPPPGWS